MISGSARPWVLALIVLIGTTVWASFLAVTYMSGRIETVDALDARFLDLRHTLVGKKTASSEVVVVAIDDETLATDVEKIMGGRERLATLISNIAQSGAHSLALDVLLTDQGNPEEDAALANSLTRLPTSIAAAARFSDVGEMPVSTIWPHPIFGQAAQVGLVNFSTDHRGTPRYVPLLLDIDGEIRPSLALLASLTFAGENADFAEAQLSIGERSIPLDLGFNMPLRYLGPAGSIPTFSARRLLDGPVDNLFEGKLVVLGYTASAMGDRFVTPFDDSTPGVEIVATAISQLLGGPTLRRDSQVRKWDSVHAVVLSVLCVLVMLVWPLSLGTPVAATLLALSMISAAVFFASGLWLSVALPLLAAVPPMVVAGVCRYSFERQQADRSRRAAASLRRFQSPALAARIETDPEYLVNPVEKYLVILFVDLTGFTSLSQRIGPAGTRNLLRLFHKLVAEAVEAHGGSVFNYMGDGALAVFGLEANSLESASDGALESAFDLVKRLLHQRFDDLPDENLQCRIGLHSGVATLSRLGAESHQQVTVSGDSVNLASRLMEVAKSAQAVIVASDQFAVALSNSAKSELAQHSDVAIRGRSGDVRVLLWTSDVIVANT